MGDRQDVVVMGVGIEMGWLMSEGSEPWDVVCGSVLVDVMIAKVVGECSR